MSGARAWIILLAIVLARIGFGFQFQTVATLGPQLMRLFRLDYATLGWLIGAYMLAGVFVALLLGLLGRRFGDRAVFGGGLALMAAGGAVSAFGPGVGGIALGRVVAGIGAVAVTVLQSKVVADWFPGRFFMLAISTSVAAYPVGIGLAQIVAPVLASRFGWPAPFLAGGIGIGATAALFVVSYRASPLAARVPRALSLPSWPECRRLVVAGLIWTAYTAGYAGFLSYVPSLLSARGEGLALISLVMALASWGNVPGTLIGGGLAGRFGSWPVFLTGTLCVTVGIAAMGAIEWPVLWGFVVGVLGSIQPGVIIAVGTLSARPENRAAGMGIFYTVYYLGGTIAPGFCGWAADLSGGPAGAMYAAAAISVLAVPMFMLHHRMTAPAGG